MDKNFNAWESGQNLKESISERAKHSFGEYLNEIILVACVLFTVAIPLVSVEFINPFSAEFIANSIYMTVSTYLCYLIFIPSGKRDKINSDKGYSLGLSQWQDACRRVKSEHGIVCFSEYCKREEAEEVRTRIANFANFACMDADEFSRLLHKPRKLLRELLKTGKLSSLQYKYLKRAGKIKARPIKPQLIISSVSAGSVNDAGRGGISYEGRCAITRPFYVALTSLVFASSVLVPTGSYGIGIVITVICRLLGIGMASFAGYGVGVNQIKWEMGRTEGKILFIEKFLEKQRTSNEKI